MNSADLYITISELGSKKSQTSDTEIPRAKYYKPYHVRLKSIRVEHTIWII